MPSKSHAAGGFSERTLGLLLFGTAIIVGVVVLTAIFFRSGGFSVVAEGQGAKLELKFDESRVDLNQILEQMLKQAEAGPDAASKRLLVASILQAHGFYPIPSTAAADALRRMEETDATHDFARAVRTMLYDLAGPFARPLTFQDAPDARVLLAIDDLYERNPTSPVVAQLWQMSLEMKGIFEPRDIAISIREDKTLRKGVAATCAGSILLGKVGQIRTSEDGRLISPRVDVPRACGSATSEAAPVERKERVWLSTTDMNDLIANATSGASKELPATLTPLPKNLSPEDRPQSQ